MRAALLAIALIATTAHAEQPRFLSGGELMELRHACFGDDAIAATGTRKGSNDACAYWDEEMAKAKAAGYCLDEDDDFSWKPCA